MDAKATKVIGYVRALNDGAVGQSACATILSY